MSEQPKRLRDLGIGRRDCIMINPKLIRVEEGHNPRNYRLPENRAHLDELKKSIEAIGIQVPLLVRWENGEKIPILVDGECRLQAALELIKEGFEILSVPVMQAQGDNEPDRLVLALTANTGKPLSKWEIGSAFKRFIAWGWDADKIAAKMGYPTRYVNECIELSDATEQVKQLLSEEAVTPSLALKHIRADGSNAGPVLAEKARTARAKAPAGKKPTPAKRERKQTGIRLTAEQAAIVVKALKAGAKSDDAKLTALCQEAFEAIDGASTK
jgi:ParB-like chromosome segregation protein Spo0J